MAKSRKHSWHRVMAVMAPGVTAGNPSNGEKNSLHGAMAGNRLQSVVRTAWRISTTSANNRGNQNLIATDQTA